jgi:hypothetical protein
MNPDENRSPERLEREIAMTRAEIDDTLSAIQNRLSPDRLMHQAVDYVRGGAGGYFSNLGATVKQNPVPVTMLGISLAWLMISGRSGARERYVKFEEFGGAPSSSGTLERMGSTVSEAGTRISDTMHDVTDKARGASDWARVKGASARATASEWTSEARDRYYRARYGLETTFNDYPLVLGAFGVALGAALGAGLPSTRREDEWMGATSDEFVSQTKKTVKQEFDKNREKLESVAEKAAEAAKDEARQQELMPGESTSNVP